MALTYQVPYLQTAKITPQSWSNSDSANTKKTVCTAGTNGSKVVGVSLTSTDTSTRIAQLWLVRAAVSYLLASLTIAVTAGADGATAVANLINTTIMPSLPIDNDGQPYLFLESGDLLKISFTTQVTSGKEIDAAVISADF